MPKHNVYIEPCMGSAEVFFRKPRAEKEKHRNQKETAFSHKITSFRILL